MAIIAIPACLAACSTFPELDGQISPAVQSADYPALLPAEDLRAQVSTGPLEPRETPIFAQAEQIDNRADALRARAASLRGDVIEEEDRDRLDQDITIDDEEV
ncbi:MAG: hypothetical protein AAFY25_03330 [Pseudomonadota bacterium]